MEFRCLKYINGLSISELWSRHHLMTKYTLLTGRILTGSLQLQGLITSSLSTPHPSLFSHCNASLPHSKYRSENIYKYNIYLSHISTFSHNHKLSPVHTIFLFYTTPNQLGVISALNRYRVKLYIYDIIKFINSVQSNPYPYFIPHPTS